MFPRLLVREVAPFEEDGDVLVLEQAPGDAGIDQGVAGGRQFEGGGAALGLDAAGGLAGFDKNVRPTRTDNFVYENFTEDLSAQKVKELLQDITDPELRREFEQTMKVKQNLRGAIKEIFGVEALGYSMTDPMEDFAESYRAFYLDPELLAAARERLPGVPLHQADMRALDLGRTFDVVTCLFSAIGYMLDLDQLAEATTALANHVAPGGLLLVEPWLTPDAWQAGRPHALAAQDDRLAVTRMSRSGVDGRISWVEMDYLVSDGTTLEQLSERHELGPRTLAEAELDQRHKPAKPDNGEPGTHPVATGEQPHADRRRRGKVGVGENGHGAVRLSST